MTDPQHYNINLRRITVDGEALYEARVREFPDATEFADTAQEAYELALDTIEVSLEVLQEQGKSAPMPMDFEEEYSGRVTLRVPKSLHRRLAEQADHEGVSLNQYLVTVLAHNCGTGFDAHRNKDQNWQRASKRQTREAIA